MNGAGCRLDQTSHLFLAEYLREMQNLLRIGRLGDAPASLQYLHIEKTQGRQSLRDGVRLQFPVREQRGLILPNMLRAKLIGWTAEVAAEMLYRTNVSPDGRLGIVAAMQLFKHELA